MSEGQPAVSEGQLAGSEGQPEGGGQMDVLMEFLPTLQDFVPCWGSCSATFETSPHQNSRAFYFFYKDHIYKKERSYICSNAKNIVVILLVAIFISFQAFTPDKMFL